MAMSTLETTTRLILSGLEQAARGSAVAAVWISRYVYAAIAWPFTTLASTLFFIISPAVYTIYYGLAPFFYVLGLLPSLKVRSFPKPAIALARISSAR